MRTAIFFLLLLIVTVHTLPTREADITTELQVVDLQKDINLVSYIQNFKTVMAEYVNSQYRNLTINEMEKVKSTLEDFLKEFANDLRDTVQGNNNEGLEENIDDGLSNATFQDIKMKIVHEFPDVDEDTADKIVKKLRKNLYTTRYKLDEIIRESQRAQIENS